MGDRNTGIGRSRHCGRDTRNNFKFDAGGRRYCHILDATTGWPVQGWQSVSVAAPLCVVAGSGATVGMLLGDAAPAWLDAQRVDWLGVDAAGRVRGRSARID